MASQKSKIKLLHYMFTDIHFYFNFIIQNKTGRKKMYLHSLTYLQIDLHPGTDCHKYQVVCPFGQIGLCLHSKIEIYVYIC